MSSSYLTTVQRAALGRPASLLCHLSKRQQQVLEMIADGQTTVSGAMVMHVSPKTFEYHRAILMAKAHCNDIAGLTKLAIRLGLADCHEHHRYD